MDKKYYGTGFKAAKSEASARSRGSLSILWPSDCNRRSPLGRHSTRWAISA